MKNLLRFNNYKSFLVSYIELINSQGKENLLVIIATMTKDSFSDSKFPENIVFLTYEPEMDENDILQKYMIHGESYENLKGILERFIYKKRNISISTKESINA